MNRNQLNIALNVNYDRTIHVDHDVVTHVINTIKLHFSDITA